MGRERHWEGGGWNIYAFVANNGMLYWDYIGLAPRFYQAGGVVDKILTSISGCDRVADGIMRVARDSNPSMPPVPDDSSGSRYASLSDAIITGDFYATTDENSAVCHELYNIMTSWETGVGASFMFQGLEVKLQKCGCAWLCHYFVTDFGSVGGSIGIGEGRTPMSISIGAGKNCSLSTDFGNLEIKPGLPISPLIIPIQVSFRTACIALTEHDFCGNPCKDAPLNISDLMAESFHRQR